MPGKRRLLAVTPAAIGDVEQSIVETLDKLVLQPEDAGLRSLALRYGRTIDESAALAEAAAQLPYDPDTAAQVARLKQRVDAHVVMSELGPKLLAALDALGATPKARAAAGRPPPAGPTSKLTAMRGDAS